MSTILKQRRNAADHNLFKNKGSFARNPLPDQALARAPKPPACLGVKQPNVRHFRSRVPALVPGSTEDRSPASPVAHTRGAARAFWAADLVVVQPVPARPGCSGVCCRTLNMSNITDFRGTVRKQNNLTSCLLNFHIARLSQIMTDFSLSSQITQRAQSGKMQSSGPHPAHSSNPCLTRPFTELI